jgi:hypothetical protein
VHVYLLLRIAAHRRRLDEIEAIIASWAGEDEDEETWS